MTYGRCHQVPGLLWVVIIGLLVVVALVLVVLALEIGRELIGGHRHDWGEWRPRWESGSVHSHYWLRHCKTCNKPSRSRWRQ